MDILNYDLLNNTLGEYAISISVFFASFVLLKIFKNVVIKKLKELSQKNNIEIDDVLINAVNAVHWPFYVLVSIYLSFLFINTPAFISRIIFYIFLISVTYYVVRFIEDLVEYGFRKIAESRDEVSENTGVIKLLQIFVKVSLWTGAIVLILSNIGYNVSSLIAGLGIGGIAIALALQSVLSDLFASISIYFDKPFKIGDFIVLGDKMGTVKDIGIKTTRIQAPQGEELVISNSELTSARIQNFGKMKKRRIVFNIGVAYDTKADVLEKISKYLRDIVEKIEDTEVDRIHFKSFGDFSLNYEIVYYVLSSNYADYMNIQERINLEIIKKFEQEKIEIAFPTQTLYIKK